ncbi:hypothetical protein PLICRDRAFT_37876 [Plicaturopsis crispa FD-325 SS-3]|nr:hypothetical protein PLICRDRAFT_37876 [Plicaturopsis crispa FD-325 SS-3]
MYSAGHDYSLGFRVNNQPAPFVHGRSLIARDRIERASQRHTRDGWRPFGWFYLDERSSIHSACTVTRGDLIDVHDALYGPSTAGTLGAAVGPRETALLLLASVGIPFNVARTEAEAHPNQYDVNDGYIVQWGGESPCLALDTPKPGLSAAHLRKIRITRRHG